MAKSTAGGFDGEGGGTRRDFLDLLTWSTVGIGAASLIWPFVDQMNPSADVLAQSTTDVDLSQVSEGMAITVMWRGKPVFVRHRTPDEIKEAEEVPVAQLRDPQTDQARVQQAPWLVVIGICTHLGCVPGGNRPTENRGPFGGWFCPCHGSAYDTSGRIRQGPAPLNLAVPPYAFDSETQITIG